MTKVWGINASAILLKIEILISMDQAGKAVQELEKVLSYAENDVCDDSDMECTIFDKLDLEENSLSKKQAMENLIELLEKSPVAEILKQQLLRV